MYYLNPLYSRLSCHSTFILISVFSRLTAPPIPLSKMSSKSVLLTGATGSVGAHVLQQLLENGHSVTAVVRSLKKSSKFLSQKYASSFESGKFVIAEVPDLTGMSNFFALISQCGANRIDSPPCVRQASQNSRCNHTCGDSTFKQGFPKHCDRPYLDH
jgi:hypothetical protein